MADIYNHTSHLQEHRMQENTAKCYKINKHIIVDYENQRKLLEVGN